MAEQKMDKHSRVKKMSKWGAYHLTFQEIWATIPSFVKKKLTCKELVVLIDDHRLCIKGNSLNELAAHHSCTVEDLWSGQIVKKMTPKQKLINILKIHSELAAAYAASQAKFDKDKLNVAHLFKIERGKEERNYNQSILRQLPNYAEYQKTQIALTDFWADLEPDLTETLRGAIEQAQKVHQKPEVHKQLKDYLLYLDMGKRLSADKIRQIIMLLND